MIEVNIEIHTFDKKLLSELIGNRERVSRGDAISINGRLNPEEELKK